MKRRYIETLILVDDGAIETAVTHGETTMDGWPDSLVVTHAEGYDRHTSTLVDDVLSVDTVLVRRGA